MDKKERYIKQVFLNKEKKKQYKDNVDTRKKDGEKKGGGGKEV